MNKATFLSLAAISIAGLAVFVIQPNVPDAGVNLTETKQTVLLARGQDCTRLDNNSPVTCK